MDFDPHKKANKCEYISPTFHVRLDGELFSLRNAA